MPIPADALSPISLQDPLIDDIITCVSAPWPPLNSHKSAGHPLHQLVFLADIGLTVAEPRVAALAERILATADPSGPLRVTVNIAPAYGGSGQDQLAWALCDAPLLLYALIRFGLGEHPAVRKALERLLGLQRPNGWPCAVSQELGKFRGPGRKDDPCPFANLIMLQTLAQLPEYLDSPAAHTGVEAALVCWAERGERHPYMFFMGDDFCKLKAPLVWYDLLHVLDVLTRFPWAIADPRLQQMLAILRAKADAQGYFTPESVWMAWKAWDFGQKKAPSLWLTHLAWGCLERSGQTR